MSSETHELKLKLPAEARATAAALASELEKVEERAEGGAEKLRGVARELAAAERTARKFEEAIQEVAAGTLTLKPENAALLAQGYEQARSKVGDLGAALAQAKAAQKATTSEADKLRDGIRAATNEAKKLERDGARATEKALKDAVAEAKKLEDATAHGVKRGIAAAREEAERLSRGLEAAVGLQRRASGAGGGISLGLSVAGAAANLAATGIQAAVNAAVEWIRTIPEGAAAAERHREALSALGSGYQEVQRETRGVVTADQAFQIQQQISQAGLSLTGRQLGLVTGRARDYARATGTDLQQALGQLTEGLRSGSNEQLRRFGLTVEQGATRTQTFRSVLEQLNTQQGHTARATLTLTEAQEQLKQATTELSQKLQHDLLGALEHIAQDTGFIEFLTQTASYIRDLADNTRTLSGELRNAAAAFGLVDSARAQHINQSASGEFTQQFSAARERLQALGGDVSRIGAIGQFAVNATPAQRQQALDTINAEIRLRSETRSQGVDPRTQRAGRGLFGDTNLHDVQDVSGSIRFGTGLQETLANIFQNAAQEAEARRRDEALQRDKSERERQQALTEQERRERAAQHHGGGNAPDPRAVAEARAQLERAQRDIVQAGFGRGLGLRAPDPAFHFDSGDGVELVREDPTKRNSQQEQLEVLRQRAADTQARRGETELARLQRLTQATQAYQQAQVEQATRERTAAEETQRAAVARNAQELLSAEQRREHELEAHRMRIEQLNVRQQSADAARALADAERMGREEHATQQDQLERLDNLTKLRSAMHDLLIETEARIAQAQVEGRSQADINRLIQERIGLQRSIAQVSQEQTQIQQQQHAATTAWKDSMVGALEQTTEAFAGASIAALESGKSFADAMREMLRSTLFALAKQSIVETIKNTALGFAALAGFNPGSATNFFAAAGLWAAVGLASGGIASAIPKPSTAAPAGASATSGVRERPQLGSGDRGVSSGPLTININTSGALMNSEQLQDAMVRGLNAAHARGVIPRFVRN